MLGSEQRGKPPENGQSRRIHWSVVAALWALAALWISVDPLTGSHSDYISRWMGDVSLLLVAAACTVLIVWLMQRFTPEPQRSDCAADRAFELGYHAGHADALTESRLPLGLASEFPSARRTGT